MAHRRQEFREIVRANAGPYDSFVYLDSKEEYDTFMEEFGKQSLYTEDELTVWTQAQMDSALHRDRFASQFPQALNSEYFVVLDHR